MELLNDASSLAAELTSALQELDTAAGETGLRVPTLPWPEAQSAVHEGVARGARGHLDPAHPASSGGLFAAAGCDGMCKSASELRSEVARLRASLREKTIECVATQQRLKQAQDEAASQAELVETLRAELALRQLDWTQLQPTPGVMASRAPILQGAAPTSQGATTFNELRAMRTFLEERVTAARAATDASDSALQTLTRELQELRKEHLAVRGSCQSLLAQQQQLTRQLEAGRAAAEERGRELHQARELVAQLRGALQQADDRAADMLAAQASREASLQHIQSQLQLAEITLTKKGDLLTRANESMQLQESALARLRGELFALRVQAEGFDRQLSTLQQEKLAAVAQEHAKHAQVHGEVDELRRKLKVAQASLLEKTNECSQLESSLVLAQADRAKLQCKLVDLEQATSVASTAQRSDQAPARVAIATPPRLSTPGQKDSIEESSPPLQNIVAAAVAAAVEGVVIPATPPATSNEIEEPLSMLSAPAKVCAQDALEHSAERMAAEHDPGVETNDATRAEAKSPSAQPPAPPPPASCGKRAREVAEAIDTCDT